jgi:hypothetical protein
MDRLDSARARALERADRAERQYKLAFVAAAIVELVFLIVLLLVADLSNRTHVLILAATVMSYSMVAVGLIALGAHVNRVALRILKALELGAEVAS